MRSFELDPAIADFLGVQEIVRIDPEWLPSHTFLLRRRSEGRWVEDCGKGQTEVDAWLSAVHEAVERRSAEILPPDRVVIGTFRVLEKQRPVLSPARLTADGEAWEDRELLWIEGRDLLTHEAILVPCDCVFFPYTSSFFPNTTTGLAASRTPEEAVLHALLEVMEHDTLSLYAFSGLPAQEIELTSADGYVHELAESLARQSVEARVLYLRNDYHVPVVVTLGFRFPRAPGIRVAGLGCHPDPRIATRRSLTEFCQSAAFWYRRYQADEMEEKGHYHPPLVFRRSYSARSTQIPLSGIEDSSAGEVPRTPEWVLERLRGIATHVVVVDLTRKEIGIPAVRVLVPNFEDIFDDDVLPRERAWAARRTLEQYVERKPREGSRGCPAPIVTEAFGPGLSRLLPPG